MKHEVQCVYTCLYVVCTQYIHVCTWFISVHPVECLYMVHLSSSWFIFLCWNHFLEVCCLYSPVLACTSFKQYHGTGICHSVPAWFIQGCTWLWQDGSFPVAYLQKRVCQWMSAFVQGWTLLSDVCTVKWAQESYHPARAILRGYIPVWTLSVPNGRFLYHSIV